MIPDDGRGLQGMGIVTADIAITLSPPREGRLLARKLTDYRLGLYGLCGEYMYHMFVAHQS